MFDIQTSWISCSVRHSLSYWVLQIWNHNVVQFRLSGNNPVLGAGYWILGTGYLVLGTVLQVWKSGWVSSKWQQSSPTSSPSMSQSLTRGVRQTLTVTFWAVLPYLLYYITYVYLVYNAFIMSCRTGWSTSSHSSPRIPPPGTKGFQIHFFKELCCEFQSRLKPIS